jgi:hypothetical protein
MTDAWRRVDQVLQAALLRPPGERDRLLRQACAGDAALENEVRSLLAADAQAGSFLEDPAIHAAARALAERVQRETGNDTAEQVDHAFVLTLQRWPDKKERGACLDLLQQRSLAELCRALLNLNEFIYVD